MIVKTLIVTDARVILNGDKYYTENTFFDIISRYCKNFGNVTLFTRVITTNDIPRNFKDITSIVNDIVDVHSLMSVMLGKKNKIIDKLVSNADFIILRIPSLVSLKVSNYLRRYNKPYMTELMGDTWDGLWNHGILGKIIAPYAYLKTKYVVKKANYATYVTSRFLQNRYPCLNESISASNVSIKENYTHKSYNKFDKKNITLFTAAAVNVKYKGQQYVIKAISKLKKHGINVTYYLAGKGDNTFLKNVAKKYNVEKNVIFFGPLQKAEVLNKMSEIDIYIQPSLQEGLPRSMIEAMSCGCVCLGARTAGIPELIGDKFIFKRKSVNSIVKKILYILDCNLIEISNINTKNSKNYFEEKLNKRRFNYYQNIIKIITSNKE